MIFSRAGKALINASFCALRSGEAVRKLLFTKSKSAVRLVA
jgi:hypothetical protein